MSSADEWKNVFRPRTAEVYLLITEGMKSIRVRVELITCKIEKQERRKWGPSNLCINTPPYHHLSCCSVANSLQVTFASRGEQRCLLVLLLLLVTILKFNCTTKHCWNEPFCRTKDSYVHCSQRGWINRPVSHDPSHPPKNPPQAVTSHKRSKRLSEEEVSRLASRAWCLRPDWSFGSVRVAMVAFCSTRWKWLCYVGLKSCFHIVRDLGLNCQSESEHIRNPIQILTKMGTKIREIPQKHFKFVFSREQH